MLLFHSAAMVVAPHGAGLANIVFSRPGTYVIEGVCPRPKMILCFQRLAVILGLHWHGLLSDGGCPNLVNVSARDVLDTVVTYLDIRNKTMARK